jgi:hypothetical protein
MRCLCVAFKYNDVFYTINVPKFDNCNYKKLVIFESESIKASSFPFLDFFDEIQMIKYRPTWKGILVALYLSYKLREEKFDVVFLSNVRLLISKYILSKTKKSIILIEDGAMNYLNDNEKENVYKRIASNSLNIDNLFEKRIVSTYLLKPNYAVYYYGNRKKLMLTKREKRINELVSKLNNSVIFVGGNYYDYNMIDIDDYNKLVQNIILKYNIDYYIPHQGSSSKENINCKSIDLSFYKASFEMVLPYVEKCTIFSIGSSVLLTSVFLNDNINSFIINTGILEFGKFVDIFSKYCNVVNLDDKYEVKC